VSHTTKSVRIGSGRRYTSEVWVEEDQELPVHPAVHIGVTLLLWTSSVAIAILFGDLTVVLALTGSLAGSMLGYIIPAAIYFKTYEQEWSIAWRVLVMGKGTGVYTSVGKGISSGSMADTNNNDSKHMNTNTNDNDTGNDTDTDTITTELLGDSGNGNGSSEMSISDRIHCFFSECSGGKFILPVFMMIFGIIAMVIGVGTVIIGLYV